ncbi:hypothetical protein [Streptomyces sp. NPDC051704]|uniref:hypothetical protein n=1 Tax=Streptomyces sp. NPDC051704 TaxID=3365671 RepID=UPI0037A93853
MIGQRFSQSLPVAHCGIADVLASHRSGGKLRTAARTLAVAVRQASCLWVLWHRRAAGHLGRRDVHPVRAVMLPLDVMDAEVTMAWEDRSDREFR